MRLKVDVIHGRREGPVTFVSGAIHGDEIIGVEIIRRLLELKLLERIRGTLILVPVVNAYGFVSLSRYLPDRRDLNRCFPGSANGSLASQLAHIFMREIVERADYGIDLHSAAVHRENLPQIRANLNDPVVLEMAKAFGAPVMLHANLRDGSLREAAQEVGCNMLLYEAGEALRFDDAAIRIGVKGVIGVLRHISMLRVAKEKTVTTASLRSNASHWLRAPMGGILRTSKALGAHVTAGELLGRVADPLGSVAKDVVAKESGIIIGRLILPIVNRGDALFHIASAKSGKLAEKTFSAIEQEIHEDPLFDGMEII